MKEGGMACKYHNRELSWLDFNFRVLEEANDKKNPIFERLKFLAITASNLDEFFMVRVSGVLTLIESGHEKPDISGLLPNEQLERIMEKTREFVKEQYNCLNRSVLPALDKAGFRFVAPKGMIGENKRFLKDYFLTEVFPILTPMAIDGSRPFPLVLNKSLNIIVKLDTPASDENDFVYALVQVPSVVSRVIELPERSEKDNARQFVLLEDVIKLYLPRLFDGYSVKKSFCFRITRNSDLEIHEDYADDLLLEIERSVQKRKWGEPNRLEAEKGIDDDVLDYLCGALELDAGDVFITSGIIDLTMLFGFFDKGTGEYMFEPCEPLPPVDFIGRDSMFDAIREKDILVHHPYESFDCVVRFIEEAAADTNVLAIKQTLYRVSGNSPIIRALINAALSGKQVTVLVELKARFDEENNIVWARKLEQAGCHVVYGLMGLKTHCKICLAVRREDDGIRRYIHLGTGNYNDKTAKIYTDYSFFTAREAFGADVSSLFNTLTGFSEAPEWKKLAVAPKTLRPAFESRIANEISLAESGVKSRIIIKVNSLVDGEMIDRLYDASCAGVQIDLIVRGMCCLLPGVKGLSENIRVVSIIGRFLEHSRIYYFENGGAPKVFLSSADLMPRNLDRRVEVAFPVEQDDLREEIISALGVMLADTAKLRVLRSDGTYERVRPKRNQRSQAKGLSSQVAFYELAKQKYKSFILHAEKEAENDVFFTAGNSEEVE